MEGEHHYELRSRSRSRSHTPMITNQIISDFESIEHHYDLRSKESRERSYTPAEVSSSRRSNSRLLSNSVQKLKDKNIDSIAEKPEVIQPEIRRENEYKQNNSDSIPPALKKAERRSERQSLKRQIFINEYEESKDNTIFVKEIMKQQQDHQHHHHYHHHQQQQQQQQGQEQEQQLRKSLTPSRTVTSDYSSEEGERDDLLNRPGSAYEIYKQAGEWWKYVHTLY
ncbi:hypothetical protein PV327_007319 [Microctonus hyperodae]|uniref:Uncharacterized protein n=1 Tax=Microctonus hyperodae TaxID=165561 RepID=A0AA39KJC8_MICHY|nr:hypothetical protein PV327_007319 [Microctonus hyperodae]